MLNWELQHSPNSATEKQNRENIMGKRRRNNRRKSLRPETNKDKEKIPHHRGKKDKAADYIQQVGYQNCIQQTLKDKKYREILTLY